MGIRDKSIDISQSKALKGIAILLMLVHHFFGFESWLMNGNFFFGLINEKFNILNIIGRNSRICVAIFAFLTGYAFFIPKKQKFCKINWEAIISFLINYWIILFLVFVPINYIFKCGYFFDFKILIKNVFGIGNCLSRFAWYVWFFIIIKFSFPFLAKLLNKKWKCIFVIMLNIVCYFIVLIFSKKYGSNIITSMLGELFTYYPCVICGFFIYYFETFDYFIEKTPKKMKKTKVAYISILVLFIIRYILGQRKILDAFFVAPFIYFVTIALKKGIITKLLIKISNHSTNLWFLHGIYFMGNGMLQKILYWPRLDILILFWGILLLIPISILCNVFKFKILHVLKLKN